MKAKVNHEQQLHWHQTFMLLLLLGLVSAVSLVIQSQLAKFRAQPVELGATYSTKYAYWLGLDSHKAFVSMLDDLKIRDFRLPVYWSDIEKSAGDYDWNETKWLLDEAAKRDAKVTIAIGVKVPRYPECFVPDWAIGLSPEKYSAALNRYLESGVRALNDKPALVAWQVENEPMFKYFGDCPMPDPVLLKKEIAAVRGASDKLIMTTSSGEFGSWVSEGLLVDKLGISLYRGAYIGKIGYFAYPAPSWYYSIRRVLAQGAVKDIFISELQVEPWLQDDMQKVPVPQQITSMPISKIKANLEFAHETGFRRIWLWGPEWWLYLKEKHGIDTYWEYGKTLFTK
ncbi:MAG: hypothetical protein WCJ29_03795 [bacterium]